MVKKFQGDIYLVGHNRHMIKSCKTKRASQKIWLHTEQMQLYKSNFIKICKIQIYAKPCFISILKVWLIIRTNKYWSIDIVPLNICIWLTMC